MSNPSGPIIIRDVRESTAVTIEERKRLDQIKSRLELAGACTWRDRWFVQRLVNRLLKG